jgi:hypothetical protein
MKVEVIETIKFDYPKKDDVTNDYQWIYTVSNNNRTLKLSQIKKWDNFQNDNVLAGMILI